MWGNPQGVCMAIHTMDAEDIAYGFTGKNRAHQSMVGYAIMSAESERLYSRMGSKPGLTAKKFKRKMVDYW